MTPTAPRKIIQLLPAEGWTDTYIGLRDDGTMVLVKLVNDRTVSFTELEVRG